LQGKIDLSGVVQQTLLEAHQSWEKIQDKELGEKTAWLRRILANNLADEIRKFGTAKRDLTREKSLEAALEASSQRLQGWLASEQSSPSRQIERQEQGLELAGALAELPPAQCEALVLQHWHGWSLAQIAEHMGKTRAAVAGLIKRGLQRLRVELQELE
jgi:RNA polymerase sigma-70 factor (ECF subfamily)